LYSQHVFIFQKRDEIAQAIDGFLVGKRAAHPVDAAHRFAQRFWLRGAPFASSAFLTISMRFVRINSCCLFLHISQAVSNIIFLFPLHACELAHAL